MVNDSKNNLKEIELQKQNTVDQYSNKLGPQAKVNSQHILLMGHKPGFDDDLPLDNQSDIIGGGGISNSGSARQIDINPKIEIDPEDADEKYLFYFKKLFIYKLFIILNYQKETDRRGEERPFRYEKVKHYRW